MHSLCFVFGEPCVVLGFCSSSLNFVFGLWPKISKIKNGTQYGAGVYEGLQVGSISGLHIGWMYDVESKMEILLGFCLAGIAKKPFDRIKTRIGDRQFLTLGADLLGT